MKILFAGASVTQGKELENPDDSFPSIICSQLNLQKHVVNTVGSSGYAVVRCAFKHLQKNSDFTHVVLQIPNLRRYPIPGNDFMLELNMHMKNVSKPISMIGAYLYKMNSNETLKIEHVKFIFDLFEFYCLQNNIKTIWLFDLESDAKHFINYNIVSITNDKIRKKYPVGPSHHPLEDGHKVIANAILEKLV